jgi:proteasome beta subunit
MEDKKIHTGTTTIGITCKDGIVLAADKRASAGYFVASKDMKKIHNITDSMAVTMAGLVSDAQLITKLIQAELRLKRMRTKESASVKEAANLLAGILYQNIRKMSMVPGIVGFLLGGNDSDGNHLYELGVDGSLTPIKDFCSTGSGSMLAYGVLESTYNPNLNVKEGIELATKAINTAINRDLATGDGLDIFVINEKGSHQVVAKKVEKILK